MDLTNPSTIATLVTLMISGGVVTELIGWVKNRRSVTATIQLTDVQTLQAKLAYVEAVAEYLQKHNDRVQLDYEESEERNRLMRERVNMLEEELDRIRRNAQQTNDELERVKRNAAQTQEECDALSAKLTVLTRDLRDGN